MRFFRKIQGKHRPYILAQESSGKFMRVLAELAGKPQIHYFLEGLFVSLCWCGAVPSIMEFYWGISVLGI